MKIDDDFKFPDEHEIDMGGPSDKKKDELEVEVEIVDDTPDADKGRSALQENVDDPTDEEVAQYSAKVQDRIKKLTHARHDERREKEALKRERDELERVARVTMAERDRLQQQLGQGAEVITTQAKTLADSDIAAAKVKLKAAHEAFDTDAIISAQEELNNAQIKKDRADNFRFTPSPTQKTVVESAPTGQEPAPRLDEKTSKWMSNNRWFGEGGDKAMTGFALGLHQDLVEKHGENFTRTDEYFSHIDKAVRRTFPDKFEGGTKKPTSVVASATRVAAGPRKVQLTSTQVALAKKFGMTPQQYAMEVAKLENVDGN
jgi:hypothetical protein